MTPQSSFMILAPIDPAHLVELRRLLASMNEAAGRVNAHNALVPFGEFDTLHVARLLIVEDMTLGDVAIYGLPTPTYPLYLAFLGDCDGDPDIFLERLATRAREGLRTIFACCEGFISDTDLLDWMRLHSVPSAAGYVNWRGRTLRHVREEAALYEALESHLQSNALALAGLPPRELYATLRQFVNAQKAAGRLTLSSDAATPVWWWIRNLLHLIGVPLLLLVTSPLLIPIAAVVLLRLRFLEKTDPELYLRVTQGYSEALALLEDHDVTNQFSALGSVAPGIVRRWTVAFVLWLIDYGARHIYTRGRLARVRTILFARWVWLDGKKRMIFLSNYDGSVESYMDDFINKVGFGLNLAFGNGIGYPRTRWLVLDGCSDERKFKEFLRRHQLPTQVWYKAYPGLTAVDLERNARIRHCLASAAMSERQCREWLALL
jgi:hypothetical protein